MSGIKGTAPGVGKFAGAAAQIVVGTIQENLFINGWAYSYANYFLFGASEVMNFVIDPTGCSCAQIVFKPLIFSASGGPILIDVYGGTDADEDGTELIPANRRETMQATQPPELVIRQNPTINSIGTKLPLSALIPSTGIAPANSSGGQSSGMDPFEIATTNKKTLKVENKDGAGIYVFIGAGWNEIPAGL